jgi:DNA invertase Pin-like site-specific DNA recombinase
VQPTSLCLPEAVRRELILEYWRSGVPTSEIARGLKIDEADVCRAIEEGTKKDEFPAS